MKSVDTMATEELKKNKRQEAREINPQIQSFVNDINKALINCVALIKKAPICPEKIMDDLKTILDQSIENQNIHKWTDINENKFIQDLMNMLERKGSLIAGTDNIREKDFKNMLNWNLERSARINGMIEALNEAQALFMGSWKQSRVEQPTIFYAEETFSYILATISSLINIKSRMAAAFTKRLEALLEINKNANLNETQLKAAESTIDQNISEEKNAHEQRSKDLSFLETEAGEIIGLVGKMRMASNDKEAEPLTSTMKTHYNTISMTMRDIEKYSKQTKPKGSSTS